MRLSFPYYLGPATWTLFHTLAEASGKDPRLVELTKAMLRKFPGVYACPFCRNHMTTLVLDSGEPKLYPLEWSILGHKPGGELTTLEEKLATVVRPPPRCTGRES
jgi:hypothetical protein